MNFTVYIIYSKSCDKFYTGHTQDFENRLVEHNSGQTKSIRSCIPWSLIWKTEFPTRAEVMKLEQKIKARGAFRFLSDIGIQVSRGA
jgi:putative endonuclease